jgi:4-hydroxy-tetrahydrodipicolinate reductase
VKIALIGYGKMGKTIERLALERGHVITEKFSTNNPFINQKEVDADVAIEFTEPSLVVNHIKHCNNIGLPVVVGTTAWYEHFNEVVEDVKIKNGSIFYATNFSLGVNLFFLANKFLARLMNNYLEYNCSIQEIHHTEKKDAPSGTAITTAEGIVENHEQYEQWSLSGNSDKSINIEALRLPNVPGTHHVNYESDVDRITLSHEAKSRDGFALGSIVAAEWLFSKKGVYNMKDLLNFDKS